MAEDRILLDVRTLDGRIVSADTFQRETPAQWERWNDYGIGMLLAGKSQLRQAQEAFRQVEQLGRFDGPLNLARAQFAEGDLESATAALARAAEMEPAPPAWTMAWLSGEVSRQQGFLQDAEQSFRSVLEDDTIERRERGFDFSLDIRVRNSLALTLLDLAAVAETRGQDGRHSELLQQAEQEFLRVLKVDSEDVTAHANLAAIYRRLGDPDKAAYHAELQIRYKADDNAADTAQPLARRKYPAADHAAEPLTIYPLQRPGAPGPADELQATNRSLNPPPKSEEVR
jgi:tetratricopeptide (TPR) repeat protein